MPLPSSINDLSQTAGSNSPSGSEAPSLIDDYLRTYASYIAQHRDGKGFALEASLASAATCDIGAANSLIVQITGTTTITSFGTNYNGPRFVRFAGALTLTHNATTLILPGGANITTAAGDRAILTPVGNPGSGWQVLAYEVAALAPGAANSATTAGSVTGTVAIANGGTGQTTAAAAFNTLKQAATEAASGVVELSTTSEAQIGTDNGTALTPLRFRDALNATGSAPTYASRTWIKLNGTGTPALQAGGNIASITDNGVGRYTLNFGSALPDANYAVIGSTDSATNTRGVFSVGTQATGSCAIATSDGNTGAAYDAAGIFVVIVR